MKNWLSIVMLGFSLLMVGSSTPAKLFLVAAPHGKISEFYLRVNDQGLHVAVVRQVPSAATAAIALPMDSNQQLYLAELRDPMRAPVFGEVGRIGGVAVVALPVDAVAHLPHGDEAPIPLIKVSSTLHRSRAEVDREELRPRFQETNIVFDPSLLRTRLEKLSGAQPVVVGGVSKTIRERGSADGKRIARAYLTEELTTAGFTVTEATYSGGVNLVAEKIGSDPSKYVIISGHLDSMNNAGADDDGSGVVSAWSIAERLAASSPKYSVRLIAFDQEELGLVGSAALAEQMQSSGQFEGLLGVFNLEMTAYDSDNDGAMHIIDCNENSSADLSRLVEASISRSQIALRKVAACTDRSDHASFWQHDQPAIVVSQNFFGRPADSNPCYHRSCDRTDKLNFEYMAKITGAVADAIAALVLE